jgi:hypothetical protein
MRKKNTHAVALGKLGGSKGGKIRAERLTAERRKEIAQKAVKARWDKARAIKQKNKDE